MPACASRGRTLFSCSPPPWLLAWARKSACAGVSGDCTWVRITSSVGSTGAASSSAKPSPSTSTPCRSIDSTKVAPRRSESPIFGGAGGAATADIGSGVGSGGAAEARFDRVEQHARDVQTELCVQFADARRAGDVHLGEKVADHVQADEDHAPAAHLRADLRGDPTVALAQGTAFAATAGGEVAAELVALRDAREAVIDRLAIHQQDALVALRDLRD